MAREGASYIEMIGTKDKWQTAVFCCTIQGDFPPVQLIYKRKTRHCYLMCTKTLVKQTDHGAVHNNILPYVKSVREQRQESDAAALVIMDNFKGQITDAIHTLLEQNNILVALLPPNTTDLLQPLDIAVKNPLKVTCDRNLKIGILVKFLSSWKDRTLLQPVDLLLPVMRELGATWIEEIAEYIAPNPHFIVNQFIRSGISRAFDNLPIDDDNDGLAAHTSDNEQDSD